MKQFVLTQQTILRGMNTRLRGSSRKTTQRGSLTSRKVKNPTSNPKSREGCMSTGEGGKGREGEGRVIIRAHTKKRSSVVTHIWTLEEHL